MNNSNFFKIDIVNNSSLCKKDINDETVSEALYTIYPFNAEDSQVYLEWNKYVIILDFKMEISDIYNDIIDMMRYLKGNEGFIISFLCNSFTAQWDFSIDGNILEINSFWTTVGTTDLKNQLEENSRINIEKKYFIEQWLKILRTIREDLKKSDYNDLEDLKDLIEIIDYYE